ncbi:hypothetical protein MRX96_025136 [Rhipicephalus microplus]
MGTLAGTLSADLSPPSVPVAGLIEVEATEIGRRRGCGLPTALSRYAQNVVHEAGHELWVGPDDVAHEVRVLAHEVQEGLDVSATDFATSQPRRAVRRPNGSLQRLRTDDASQELHYEVGVVADDIRHGWRLGYVQQLVKGAAGRRLCSLQYLVWRQELCRPTADLWLRGAREGTRTWNDGGGGGEANLEGSGKTNGWPDGYLRIMQDSLITDMACVHCFLPSGLLSGGSSCHGQLRCLQSIRSQ